MPTPPHEPSLSDEALARKVRPRRVSPSPLLLVLVAFLAGALTGWLLGRGRAAAPPPEATVAPACAPCPPPCPDEVVPEDPPPPEEPAARGSGGRRAQEAPRTQEPLEGLVKVRAEGTLKGSKLYVDGRYAGELPLSMTLASGTHTFRVVGPDGSFFEVPEKVSFSSPDATARVTLTHPTSGL